MVIFTFCPILAVVVGCGGVVGGEEENDVRDCFFLEPHKDSWFGET